MVVKQIWSLGELMPDVSCELNVSSYPEGFGWGCGTDKMGNKAH